MTDLIEPGVPVTRETLNQSIIQTALACARGVRQHQAVLEMVETGEIYTRIERMRVNGSLGTFWFAGSSNVNYKSWKNLEKRLRSAGFTLKPIFNASSSGQPGFYEVEKFKLYWSPKDAEVSGNEVAQVQAGRQGSNKKGSRRVQASGD